MAEKAGLYLSSRQLRDLATFNIEIGNHTYSHANCRSLSAEDFAREIDRNKAVLEAASGTKVRSFSVPYGSSADLTRELVEHLQSGYKAVFLAESRANPACPDPLRLNRVSIRTGDDGALFSEIEVLPRLRTIRSLLFGTANVELCGRISDLENRRPSCPSRSDAHTRIGSEVPRANPEA